jgi:L-threonylcarbamoyladenylate synthase
MIELSEACEKLNSGNVVAAPTDTVYGLFGSIHSAAAVDQINTLKNRQNKPYVIISARADIDKFYPELDPVTDTFLAKLWPRAVSVRLQRPENLCSFVNPDTDTTVWRVPDFSPLLEVLQKTGPLIAPSANPKNQPPATTAEKVWEYFGDQVPIADFKNDEKNDYNPSTIIDLTSSNPKLLRAGRVDYSEIIDLYSAAEIAVFKQTHSE